MLMCENQVQKACFLEEITMPKLQQTEDRYFITIPKSMVEKKNWKKGQDLLFMWNERGNIEIHD